ncbi:MAG: hypothetical protein KDN20_25740, partial [Verrucomicrobiae bacterium]|nr:hypothetical protein [Verrucomicrobiae bacterium]
MKLLFPAAAVAVIFLTQVQAAPPRIGYVYPAGGQRGTSFEVVVGGQYLDDPTGVYVSGEGVSAEILEHNKLPSAQVISDYRDKLREIQPSFREPRGGEKRSAEEMRSMIVDQLSKVELTEKNLRQIEEYERRRNDPKQQLNTQIGETVRVRVTVAGDAAPGIRYWRLETSSGLSNPMRFAIGELPEIFEPEPWRFDLFRFLGLTAPASQDESTESLGQRTFTLPATVNGRILPGEVDEFSFEAKEGEQVVVSLQARNLIPYLADAVPGWFQAVVSLHDTRGRELAFADDYRFDPDPVMFYKIPRDGEFRIRVHDSIYRGREDFVYRISIGELPFLTAISPLGGTAGSEVDLVFHGGNLDEHHQKRYPIPETPGVIGLFATTELGRSNSISFHADTVPEDAEREENGRIGVANELKPPGIINGTIGRPGDVDFFRVKGTGNQPMTFEIFARRLGSPVDAGLTIFDDDGNQIGFND